MPYKPNAVQAPGDLVSFAGHHAADFAFDNDPYGRSGLTALILQILKAPVYHNRQNS